MLCGNCGHDNPTDNRFCGMCGMRMERIPVPQRESSRPEYRELVRQRIGTPAPEAADSAVGQAARNAEPPKEVISFDPPNGREHASRDDSQGARGNGNAVEAPAPRSRQRAVSGPSFLNLEVPAEQPRNEERPGQTISGPSFLGLAYDRGAREGRYNIDYLLDDEPKESHWRLWLVLIILGLFGVLAWLQLRHAGVDVAGLMQRLRQAKLGTVQEQTHPTTGSSDAAPVEPDKSSQGTQTPAGQNAGATTAKGATPAADGNQAAGQPGSADATKSADATAKSADQSKSPQQSDVAGKGKAAAGAAPELKQPGSENSKSSEQATSDQAAAPEKSSNGDETSGSTQAAKSDQTVAKNTKPKKPSATVDNSEARAAREQSAQGAALVATGEKYLYGRGVPQNCERAISYLRKASDMGNAKGSSHLGAMYATGQCLPMDRVRAYKYFAVALHQDSSNQYFQHNLEMLWNEMSPDEKQQATARTPAQ